jgi:hypothetical protein
MVRRHLSNPALSFGKSLDGRSRRKSLNRFGASGRAGDRPMAEPALDRLGVVPFIDGA